MTKKETEPKKKVTGSRKKAKIKACFPKRAKRPRFARLTRLVFNGKHLQFSSRFFAKAGSICFVYLFVCLIIIVGAYLV